MLHGPIHRSVSSHSGVKVLQVGLSRRDRTAILHCYHDRHSSPYDLWRDAQEGAERITFRTFTGCQTEQTQSLTQAHALKEIDKAVTINLPGLTRRAIHQGQIALPVSIGAMAHKLYYIGLVV